MHNSYYHNTYEFVYYMYLTIQKYAFRSEFFMSFEHRMRSPFLYKAAFSSNQYWKSTNKANIDWVNKEISFPSKCQLLKLCKEERSRKRIKKEDRGGIKIKGCKKRRNGIIFAKYIGLEKYQV